METIAGTARSSGRVPDADTDGLPGHALVDTDLASAFERFWSASKAVAQNGPSDLEPSDARDETGKRWVGCVSLAGT